MDRSELISRLSPDSTTLVCGLGITGIATALWLRREGRNVICVERMSREAYLSNDKFHRLAELEAAGVRLYFGVDGEGVGPILVADRIQLAVLSPGISLASPLVGALKRAGIPYVTELELGVLLSGVPTIMVTGSNGKSTTVSLIDHLLKSTGLRSLLCGNVGVPVVAAFEAGELSSGLRARFDWLVVEASSYQLEACESLAPDIGVLLNLSDNHLERHGSMERYREAKLSMVMRQRADQVVVINCDDQFLFSVAGRLPGIISTFGIRSSLSSVSVGGFGVTIDGEALRFTTPTESFEVSIGESQLIGPHNTSNIAAALLVALHVGLNPRDLVKAVRTFTPLEHRLEYVTMLNGAGVINDSKSTTVAASVAAIEALTSSNSLLSGGRLSAGRLILCLGGAAKAGSWRPLVEKLRAIEPHLRLVICFGKDGPMIADHISAGSSVPWAVKPNVRGAVEHAVPIIEPGDILLFSPGCASFDEFTDFEHRGREFKRAVIEIFRAHEAGRACAPIGGRT